MKRAWALRVAPGCGDLLKGCADRAALPGFWSEVSGGAGGKVGGGEGDGGGGDGEGGGGLKNGDYNWT